MIVLLTRHGETIENAERILMGHNPGKLSSIGIQQAECLSKRLKKEPIDLIYSSDLARARQTTEIIAKNRTIPIIYSELLRESHLGIFQGQKIDQILAAKNSSDNFTPEGGESLEEVRNRLIKFYINHLFPNRYGTKILICGHHGSNKALLGVMLKKTIKQSGQFQQHNCCLNILEKEDRLWKAKILNDTSHLI